MSELYDLGSSSLFYLGCHLHNIHTPNTPYGHHLEQTLHIQNRHHNVLYVSLVPEINVSKRE